MADADCRHSCVRIARGVGAWLLFFQIDDDGRTVLITAARHQQSSAWE
jgi:hypothetical protein